MDELLVVFPYILWLFSLSVCQWVAKIFPTQIDKHCIPIARSLEYSLNENIVVARTLNGPTIHEKNKIQMKMLIMYFAVNGWTLGWTMNGVSRTAGWANMAFMKVSGSFI